MTSLQRLARRLRSEDGVALPAVFGLGLVMLMLIASAMTVVTGGLQRTNTDEDWNGALAAAYAGIEEYQSRLANDATYQKYGNPAAPFTCGSRQHGDPADGSEREPRVRRRHRGHLGERPGPVLASSVQSSFRYEIDNSDYQDKGILHLRSTGRVGDVTRSIVADLKQDGFIDYLWFTDYEVSDPAYTGNGSIVNGVSTCERYAYGSPARSDSTCGTIQFGTADVFGGPGAQQRPYGHLPEHLPRTGHHVEHDDPDLHGSRADAGTRPSTSAPARSTPRRSTCRRPTRS